MLGRPSLRRTSFFYALCLFVVAFSARADDTLYTKNFTSCWATYLAITSVNRHYDAASGIYNFTIIGSSPVPVDNVTGSIITTSYTTTRIAFWGAYNDTTVFCNSVTTGCPIKQDQNITINKFFQLPPSALPLGDIQTNFRVNTSHGKNYTCIDIAPVGYQNPVWREIFIWSPVVIAGFAGLVSTISTLISGPSSLQQDFFVLTSNFALEPLALRFKTPGFFDVLFYAQFIVTSGQLSLRYPMFYPLFASDFAWSSLLFPSTYINDIAASWNTANSTTSSSPSLNRRSFAGLWRRQAAASTNSQSLNATIVNITGTGMVNFANAVGLDARALFMSVLVYFLIITAVILAANLGFLLVVEYLGCWYPYRFGGQKSKIINFAIGTMLRNLLLFYLPLMTFSFYQLMLPAPWYINLVTALVLVFPLLAIPAYIAFYLLRQRPPTIIFNDMLLLLRYGPLYNTFTDESFQFFIIILIQKLFISAMVGLFQSSGISQAIVIILLEVLFFLSLYLKRPYADEAINILYLFFGGMRIVVSVLNLLYVEQVGLSNDVKQYIAYTQVFLHCVAFLVLFSLPAKNLLSICMGITPEEGSAEQRRLRQSTLRGSTAGRQLTTNTQKDIWKRSGSGSNIGLSGAAGGFGGLNSTGGMSGNGHWGSSNVSGDEDAYYAKDRQESLGPEDGIAWNAGTASPDGRLNAGYDDYSAVTMQTQNAPTGTPMRHTSLNDNLNRTQSVDGFGGIGGFYRHSRKSMRRMSKTLDDLAAQAEAVAIYQAGGTNAGVHNGNQNTYGDSRIGGSSAGGYYIDSDGQPMESGLDVELQQVAPWSHPCAVCGAPTAECGCDHSTSSSVPILTSKQKSMSRRASPGPNMVLLNRSGTNSSNGSDGDMGNGSVGNRSVGNRSLGNWSAGNRMSATLTPMSPEEAFAMTTSGALFQTRSGSEAGSEMAESRKG